MDPDLALCYAPPMPHTSPRRFWLATLGCKVNQYEARALAEAFAAKGWSPAPSPADADRIVLISCAVTARAESESRRLARALIREAKPGTEVAATGCAAAVHPEAFAALGAVPMPDKDRLAAASDTLAPCPPRPGDHFPNLAVAGYDRARALLKIQDGCSHGCTYCIVPAARGPSVSRPYPAILAEARRLLDAGHAELGLTGINLGHFGPDLAPPMSFWRLVADLERDLLASHGPAFRLRLGSLDPAMLDAEGLAVLGESRRVCRHLHISLQSADPGVLGAMNRRPNDADAVSFFVDKLGMKWGRMALGLDLLAGFPGEADTAHAATAAFLTRLPVSYAHVFPYSRRPGTPAATMAGQLPKEIKTRRAAELRRTAEDKARAFLTRLATEDRLEVAVECADPAAGSCGRYVDCRFVDAPPPDARRSGRGPAGGPRRRQPAGGRPAPGGQMSRPREPRPGKLMVSCLSAESDRLWPGVLCALQDLFGPAELVCPALPFDHTAYYNEELGSPIVRRLAAFARPYPLDGLVAAKLATNALEDRLARPDGSRRVNLDPGLVTCERLVLATGKNFTHRVYLAQGIFADLTLVFQGGSWQILPWTFPDYAAPEMLAILTDIRARCRRDLREGAVLHPFSKELPCPRA